MAVVNENPKQSDILLWLVGKHERVFARESMNINSVISPSRLDEKVVIIRQGGKAI